ncbi:hypothetical protein JCM3765_004276 [Sporobolomyces pararoseus]
MKRLIILCDGTLEDADSQPDTELYTNIGRLSRAIKEQDKEKEIEQIKFYLGGVGTEETTTLGSYVSSALGSGMLEFVRNIYSFLSLNWESGNEIFLFGFSRGAYTVRLVASLIEVIGILNPRKTLQFFPKLFKTLDQRGPSQSSERNRESGENIQKLLSSFSKEKRDQDLEYRRNGKFSIKFMGLFDTVATRGRPSTLRNNSSTTTGGSGIRFDSFGFDETRLEPCIENAFQALALDEFRIDYLPVLWSSNPLGRPKGQKLEQVWFSGSHADIGGGYKDGDLSFLTLWWMLSKLEGFLEIDLKFLKEKIMCGKTMENYGKMPPHKSRVGQFLLTKSVQRPIPLIPNPSTNEFIHFSVKFQPNCQLRSSLVSQLSISNSKFLKEMFTTPGLLELDLKKNWPTPYLSIHNSSSSSNNYNDEKDNEKEEMKSLSDSEEEDDEKKKKQINKNSSTSTALLHNDDKHLLLDSFNSPPIFNSSSSSFSDQEIEKEKSSSSSSRPISTSSTLLNNPSRTNHNSNSNTNDDQDDFSASNFRETQSRLLSNVYPSHSHSHHSIFNNPFRAIRREFRKKMERWGEEISERSVRKEDEEEWREVERQLRRERERKE